MARRAIRITYWIAPGCRIILLTVFVKTKDRDRAQVARAKPPSSRRESSEFFLVARGRKP